MSTFDGVIKEYPLISIDKFVEASKNFQSTVFFLSHCHSDHMHGLRDIQFFQLLESRGFSHIYMSDVSEHLLKNDNLYTHLSPYLVSLPMEQPTIVDIPDEHGDVNSRVVVTLLTAGHCPGSAMFLIEGQNGRVLYTGDFRLPVGGSARLPSLHDENGRLKPMDSLYVDTTFCNEKCMYIPTREQCMVEILSLVEVWLAKGPDYIVRFICSAQYNYEFVFVELFKKFGEKTHVAEDRLKKYKGIKIIEDAVTSIPTEARIHACVPVMSNSFKDTRYIYETPCGYRTEDFKPVKVRLIKPSAIFFQHKNFADLKQFDSRNKVYRVCFSTHSSLDEIRDMVHYLKPQTVYPNVVHKQTIEEILQLIGVLQLCSDSSQDSILSPLGTLKNVPAIKGDTIPSSDSFPFYDDCYKIISKCPTSGNLSSVKEYPFDQIIYKEHCEETTGKDNCKEREACAQTSKVSRIINGTPTKVTSKHDITSPVKWDFSLLSSDDEDFDPDSSYNSSKDKSDSETAYGTSEEQDLKMFDEDVFACVESKISKSEKSTKSNANPVQEYHNESNKVVNNGIRMELEKLLATQEFGGDSVDCSKPNVSKPEITYINCVNSLTRIGGNNQDINKQNINVGITKNGHEKQIVSKSYLKPAAYSEIPNQKELQAINTDIKICDFNSFHSTEINGKTSVKQTALEAQAHCEKQMTKMNLWRNRKLMLDSSDNSDSSDLEEIFSRLKPDKLTEHEVDASSIDPSTKEKVIVNKNSNSTVPAEHNKPKLLLKPHTSEKIAMNRKQSFSFENVNQNATTKMLTQQNANTAYSEKCTSENNVRKLVPNSPISNNDLYQIGKKKPSKAMYKINSQSNSSQGDTCNVIGRSYSKSSIKTFSPILHSNSTFNLLPSFSQKIRDVSASRYEKSLTKVKKKAAIIDSSESISVLSKSNSCGQSIELIDLSSDDSVGGYNSDVEVFDFDSDSCSSHSEQVCLIENGKSKKDLPLVSMNDFFSDIEVLEDSPSLLVRPKNKKKSSDSEKISNRLLDIGGKRKSEGKHEFALKKSPKLEITVDSPRKISDEDIEIDSTPEDLLPFINLHMS